MPANPPKPKAPRKAKARIPPELHKAPGVKPAVDLSDAAVVDELCDLLATGNGLEAAAKALGVAENTIRRRCYRDPDFAAMVDAARKAGQDARADEVVALARKATPLDYNAVKLVCDNLKWHIAKLSPAKYGDKVTLAGDPTAPLQIQIRAALGRLPDDDLAALAAIATKITEE